LDHHRRLLIALTAIGPVSFKIFLPSLPTIQAAFGVSAGTAQLALSLSMLGIAAATLIYGRLADSWSAAARPSGRPAGDG